MRLMDHQREGLQFLKANKGGPLFMEMGLGKTLTSLWYSYKNQSIKYTLVVCRKDNIDTWEDEINKWLPANTPYTCIKGTKKMRLVALKRYADYTIINYDAVRTDAIYKALLKQFFDYIIFDESVELKNPTSRRFKLWSRIALKCKRRSILDGMPIPNDGRDLWAQYFIADGGTTFGDNFYKFQNRYFTNLGEHFPNWVIFEPKLSRFKKKMQDSSFVARAEDCLDLPKRGPPITRKAEMSPEQKKAYTQMVDEWEVEGMEVNHAMIKERKLHQIAGGSVITDKGIVHYESGKLKVLKGLLASMRNEPVVIWATYNHELKRIAELCKSPVIYNGALSDKERKAARKRFLNGEFNEFVGQIKMGIGMNELIRSHICVFFSCDFDLRYREQSIKRLERKGQIHRVTVIDIVTENSIDVRVVQTLRRKLSFSRKVMGNDPKEYINA